MFSIPRPNVIESTDGFSVEVLGRTGLLYIEAGKSMRIDSEVLAGPSGIVIYTDSIKHWAEPNHIEPFSDQDRQRIVQNVKDAFKFRGYDIEVG